MCTVTILPTSSGIRMACNRDEAPLRPAALPPLIVDFGQRRGLMPIDPVSGGTWIAANDAGLIATILNYYARPHDRQAPTPRVSRGTIIPHLLEADTLTAAMRLAAAIDPADFANFLLVIANRERVAMVLADHGRVYRRAPVIMPGPLLFTSSGLGQCVVGPPRRALFEEYFKSMAPSPERQDAFHRHSWPERRHLSVCMRRPEARTVSYTVVEHGDENVTMNYWGVPPDEIVPGTANASSLGLQINPSARG